MSIETELREALAARADTLPAGPDDPYARVAGAIAANRRRRRATAGLVAAVTAVAVAAPVLGQGPDRTAPPATPTRTAVPGPVDPTWESVATWPTRGSLRGDLALVDGVVATVGGERAIYAEDLDGVRVVVTWQPDAATEHGRLVVVAGPVAEPEALRVVAEGEPASEAVVALRVAGRAGGSLVLLSSPRVVSAQASPGVDIRADGSVHRSWERVTLREGVGVLRLASAPSEATRVRVGGYDGPAALEAAIDPAPSSASICLDCAGPEAEAGVAAAVRESAARTLGMLRADGSVPQGVVTTLVYAGRLDRDVAHASGNIDGELALRGENRLYVAVTRLPGGGAVRTVHQVVSSAGGAAAALLESTVPIPADTAEDRPFVVAGRPEGRQDRLLVAVAAPSAARVQLLSRAPSLWPDSPVVPVVDGLAALSLATARGVEDYDVATFDGSGRRTGLWPSRPPGAEDPLDLRAP